MASAGNAHGIGTDINDVRLCPKSAPLKAQKIAKVIAYLVIYCESGMLDGFNLCKMLTRLVLKSQNDGFNRA